jgi:hypothetical protein
MVSLREGEIGKVGNLVIAAGLLSLLWAQGAMEGREESCINAIRCLRLRGNRRRCL